MQAVFRILAASFGIFAALAVAVAALMVVTFRELAALEPVVDQDQLIAFTLSLSVCWVLASVYAAMAWSLWRRRRLPLVVVYGLVALLGFESGILVFQLGAALAAATLAALIFPTARAGFSG